MLKIGFLGGGNMARAIVAGLVSSGADPKHVTVMDRHPEKLAALREQFGITTQEKPGDWITALDVVVLAVKPQGLKECCEQVASLVSPETTVLSIAAAVRADVIADWLGTRRVCAASPIRLRWWAKAFRVFLPRRRQPKTIATVLSALCRQSVLWNGWKARTICILSRQVPVRPRLRVPFHGSPGRCADAGGLSPEKAKEFALSTVKVLRRWLVRAAKRLTCFVTTSRARAARPPRQSKRLRRTTCAVQSRRRCRLAEPAAKK